ncbi:MAG: serine kinase [Fidelibacterota bacterium]|nr:MAG: serine kinase [Candidatus Neomarinimicrobiota bacterium]
MELTTIVETLDLDVKTTEGDFSQEISGVYVSDLLSDVLAHADEDNLWITLQGHPNIIAVASMKDLVGIVLVNGRMPEDETLRKANDEKIPIMTTEMQAFDLAGKLYGLLGKE